MNFSVNQKDKEDFNQNSVENKNKEEEKLNNSHNLSISLSNISLANPQISYVDNEEDINKNKKYGRFILGENIGQGTFGFVRLATHTLTGEKVAIKILDKEKIIKEKDITRLKNEIKILKRLRHNNIVQLYGVINTKLSINLIMEYCQGEELLDFINRRQRLKEMEACIIFRQIISGIEYLGKNKVAHRDLKPENIVINTDNLNIKIVDFGLSNTYKNDELLRSQCGSLCFAAPEMISGKKYNGLSADIWSSGVILFSMVCGYLPFQDEETKILYQKITKGKYQIPYYISQLAGDLIHKILNINPKKRYTIELIKKHKWFKMIGNNNFISEGLLLDDYVIPIDEDIINIMTKEYNFNENEIKYNLIKNKHNLITTSYYLILNKKIKEGKKSICNMGSIDFFNYINDKNNLLEKYEYNLDTVCQERVYNSVKPLNNIKEMTIIEENKNNHIKTEDNIKNDIVKEEMEAKLNKLHEEIDNIKNQLTNNNDKENNHEKNKGNNKINKIKMVLNEDLNSEKKKDDFKSFINEENKSDNYYHIRALTKAIYSEEKKNDNIMLSQGISSFINTKPNEKEHSIRKEYNSTISFRTKKSMRDNILKAVKNKNNKINGTYKKVSKKNINKANLKSKFKINKFKKDDNFENNLKNKYNSNNQKMNFNTNNNSFLERKNFSLLLKHSKNKMTYKQKQRKISNNMVICENKKNKNSSSKIIFNSRLLNKNNLFYRYHVDSSNNRENGITANTIYENESVIKSIYHKRHKNLSQCFLDKNQGIKYVNDSNIISHKYKSKKHLIISTNSKNNIKELKDKNYNTIQNKEQQKNSKKEIISSFSNKNSESIKKRKNESKKNIFASSKNIITKNNEVLKKIIKNKINKPFLGNNLKNNINNKIKEHFIPFDLNTLFIEGVKNKINDIIGKILNKGNIYYVMQKNKFLCSKNKINFELILSLVSENEKLFKINIINKSGNSNVYNNQINNIINLLSKGLYI